MKNIFENIQDKITEKSVKENEEQRRRIDRLQELNDKKLSKKGFHIPHPIQAVKDNREIKELVLIVLKLRNKHGNYSEIAQYNCVLFSVVAALLAFAVQSDNYLLCLLPYIVLFPILFMCETRHEGVCRIGAYLNVFAGDNYNWERRLHSLDSKKWRPLIGRKRRKFPNRIILKLGL